MRIISIIFKKTNAISGLLLVLISGLLSLNVALAHDHYKFNEYCGKYATDITNSVQVEKYAKKVPVKIRMVLIRGVLSPDEFEVYYQKVEKLLIHYVSNHKVLLVGDPNPDIFNPISLEVNETLSKVKSLAKELTLKYIVIRSTVPMSYKVDGEVTTHKGSKNFAFYTHDYKTFYSSKRKIKVGSDPINLNRV